MNHEQYLTEFTKHLRVAEPKRSDVLMELKTHIADAGDGADPERTLGKPPDLAAGYNQTHIGIFASRPVFFLIPFFAVIILFVQKQSGIARLQSGQSYNEPILSLIIPIILAIVYGQALIRIHKPLRDVLSLGGLTLLVSTAAGMLYNTMAGPHFTVPATVMSNFAHSVITALLTLILAAAVMAVTMLLANPLGDLKLLSFNLQLVVAGVILTGLIVLLTPVMLFAGIAESPTTFLAYAAAVIIFAAFFIRRLLQRRQYRRSRLRPTL